MMTPFDDTAGMASEQSSREVLNCPLVAALTPKMSDAAIRAPSESAASQCAHCHIVGAVPKDTRRTIGHAQNTSRMPRPRNL